MTRRWITIATLITTMLIAGATPATAQTDCDDPGIAVQPTAIPTEGAEDRPSNALGLTGAEWIEVFGEPIESPLPEPLVRFGSEELAIDVRFFDEEARVTGFTIRFEQSIELFAAREIVKITIPTDAERVETYLSPVSGSCVDLYHSEWLASVVEPNPELEALGLSQWPNGNPGDFIVIYGTDDPDPSSGNVSRIIFALGNNP